MMSRLDYVTVAIVVVCLAALGFLVYKTVNLMNGNSDSDSQPTVDTAYVDPYPIDTTLKDTTGFTDPAFSSTDEDLDDAQVSSYSEEDDIKSSKTPTEKSAAGKTTTKGAAEPDLKTTTAEPKSSTATKPATTAEKKTTTTTKPKTTTTTTTKPRTTVESYAVQAGAFKSKANAETLVKELKRLGYPNAEVVSTAALASAVVDRFSTYEEAAAMVKVLKTKHDIDALVKHKN